jgi:hypothetical protein
MCSQVLGRVMLANILVSSHSSRPAHLSTGLSAAARKPDKEKVIDWHMYAVHYRLLYYLKVVTHSPRGRDRASDGYRLLPAIAR